MQVPAVLSAPLRLHASNPNLSTLDYGDEKMYSNGSEVTSEFSKLQEDLCHIAHKGNWDLSPIERWWKQFVGSWKWNLVNTACNLWISNVGLFMETTRGIL